MKRILYIDPQSYKNLSLYDCNLLHYVSLPVTMMGSRNYDTSIPSNVNLQRIFWYNELKPNALKAISYLLSMLYIMAYVLVVRPQVVHIQWIKIPSLDRFFLTICHLVGAKTIFTAHNILPHDSTGQETAYGKWYNAVDHIIVHVMRTKTEMQELFGLPEEKISVIPHGILDFKPYNMPCKRTDNRICFASLGHQSYYKGCDLIVEAWNSSSILRDTKRCRLIIAGKNCGVDMSPLKDIPNVTIHAGFLDDDFFFKCMNDCDVVLLPYRAISQSGILLTLISQKKPYLATDCGGLCDPLKIGEVGWMIEHADKDLLQKAMEHIVEHPEEVASRYTTDAWLEVQQAYSWSHSGRLTRQLYERFMNNIN